MMTMIGSFLHSFIDVCFCENITLTIYIVVDVDGTEINLIPMKWILVG